ncbi:VOC family protein [Paracoccus rhizosphaerae]|uniref:VOC family protein n=1 Tax=Paracoccus rhizosphaerae TaxID=1133347 RepID=A0ABV6CLM5_9RHOB|nr:VOC family protein [Paracoccus rhizosphaerae]
MTPGAIDHVVLTVRDLPGTAAFYERCIGLEPLGGDGRVRRLGAGGRVLIELRGDPAARPRDPRQAGLFHVAILLPARADLASWLRHAADTDLRLTGASDHGVSEAIYLDDPEGNGIEIYRDRPSDSWTRHGDRIEMTTARLDLAALAAEARTPWDGAPDGTIIGHVHLQVGDVDQADAFLTGDLGLTRTFDAPGAAWYGWNGYHHHLAANTWNSHGAGRRPTGMAGLEEVVLRGLPEETIKKFDPWGNKFTRTEL